MNTIDSFGLLGKKTTMQANVIELSAKFISVVTDFVEFALLGYGLVPETLVRHSQSYDESNRL